MTLADMLRQLSPEQQSFFLQSLLMSGPRQNPPLGMSQYLPPQGNMLPPNVAQYMAIAPSIPDSGVNGQQQWPQNYRGWRDDYFDALNNADNPQTPAGWLKRQLQFALQNQQNNFPRNEQDIAGLSWAPKDLMRLPSGQYVPFTVGPVSPNLIPPDLRSPNWNQ